MKKYLFLFSLLFLGVLMSCEKNPSDTENCFCESDPPRNDEKVVITQGLWGDVWFWKGNFMPPGRGEVCQVKRKILIYELTTPDDVVQPGDSPFYTEINTNRIASIESDKHGFFQIELEEGIYSIFVEEDGKFYSNRSSQEGIYLITIESGQVTEIRFDITYEAYY